MLFHDFKLRCHNTILIPENIAGKCLARIYFLLSKYWIQTFAEHVRKDTLWNFSFRAFHEIWNTFTLVSKFHCVCFPSITKIVYRESINFDEYLFPIKQKKNSKRPKPWLKNRNDKSATIFCVTHMLALMQPVFHVGDRFWARENRCPKIKFFFFLRWVLFFKGSCTLLSNLKSC